MSLAADLKVLWRSSGFRRLTVARLLSQGGDGMFQVGIATTFFFKPEEATSAAGIAAGFAVLLAPFTLVGPFVGPLIDRWQRQRIILVGNLVRVGLVIGIVATMQSDGPTWLLYALALATLSINRFLLAAMAAGIPQVVPPAELLTANAILPTLGTIAAAAGAALGGIVTFLVPAISSDHLALTSLAAAGIAFGASSWASTRIGWRELGPLKPLVAQPIREQAAELVTELRDGARYLRARVTPYQALLIMGAQRLLYGLMFVASILISRHVLGDPEHPEDALGKFIVVLGFAAVGFGIAAALTPTLGARVGRHQWVVVCLVVGAAGQSLLAISSEPWALFGAAVVVSFAVQGGKIAVDTIVQRDTEDQMRGRAFTLYDMTYNVAFISSAAIGALVLPDTGYSRPVMGALVVVYLVLAAVYARAPQVPSPAGLPSAVPPSK